MCSTHQRMSKLNYDRLGGCHAVLLVCGGREKRSPCPSGLLPFIIFAFCLPAASTFCCPLNSWPFIPVLSWLHPGIISFFIFQLTYNIILISGVKCSDQTCIYLTKWSPNKSSTHLALYIAITILVTMFPVAVNHQSALALADALFCSCVLNPLLRHDITWHQVPETGRTLSLEASQEFLPRLFSKLHSQKGLYRLFGEVQERLATLQLDLEKLQVYLIAIRYPKLSGN